MRLTSLFLLPLISSSSIVLADQIPLKDKASGWFDKAKSYIPSSVPVPNPIAAGAAQVAKTKVEKINVRNYQRKLSPKLEGEEEWLVYFTGGNKTCFGRCEPIDEKWNESVPLISALPKPADSPNLRLGYVDCDKEDVICTAWAAAVPAVWHFTVPQKTEPPPKVPLHIVKLNVSTAEVSDIVAIPSFSKATYLENEEYTGILHPLDGGLAKLGLLTPFGYLMWGFGSTPSWMVMIGISFFSRQFMARRAGTRPGFGGINAQSPTEPVAAPRPQQAAAPGGGGGGPIRSGGGKKKR